MPGVPLALAIAVLTFAGTAASAIVEYEHESHVTILLIIGFAIVFVVAAVKLYQSIRAVHELDGKRT